MILRFTKADMGHIWSDATKFRNWARVEIAVLEARYELGELSVPVPHGLLDSLRIDPEEIHRIESEVTKQDVRAFLLHTSPQLPEDLRPHWHYKMTSYDPQDTGLSLQLVESVDLFKRRVEYLSEVLKRRALEYKNTPMMGRTHGGHAEPITFGVKLANWYDECQRHIGRLVQLLRRVSVGKISGAVGMYTLSPRVEELVCRKLGLKPIVATQIISRDIIAEYMALLSLISGTLQKMGVTLRTLQRTEIFEVEEYYNPNISTSSAMPHKRSPLGPENVSGNARVIRGYTVAAFEDQETWDERSLDNSGPERIIVPDASILLDYMLFRMTGIMDKLIVYPERMLENLNLTKGLIYSQDVLSLLTSKSGLPREEAYSIVGAIARQCARERTDFLSALLAHPVVMQHVSESELKSCFDMKEKLRFVDDIFRLALGTAVG